MPPSSSARSHPSRVRGLKSTVYVVHPVATRTVAPFTGAWIEIEGARAWMRSGLRVAPFTGAWIEISNEARLLSMPVVAPFTGAWIEITGEREISIK